MSSTRRARVAASPGPGRRSRAGRGRASRGAARPPALPRRFARSPAAGWRGSGLRPDRTRGTTRPMRRRARPGRRSPAVRARVSRRRPARVGVQQGCRHLAERMVLFADRPQLSSRTVRIGIFQKGRDCRGDGDRGRVEWRGRAYPGESGPDLVAGPSAERECVRPREPGVGGRIRRPRGAGESFGRVGIAGSEVKSAGGQEVCGGHRFADDEAPGGTHDGCRGGGMKTFGESPTACGRHRPLDRAGDERGDRVGARRIGDDELVVLEEGDRVQCVKTGDALPVEQTFEDDEREGVGAVPGESGQPASNGIDDTASGHVLARQGADQLGVPRRGRDVRSGADHASQDGRGRTVQRPQREVRPSAGPQMPRDRAGHGIFGGRGSEESYRAQVGECHQELEDGGVGAVDVVGDHEGRQLFPGDQVPPKRLDGIICAGTSVERVE